MDQESPTFAHEHRREGFEHSHDLDEGLVIGDETVRANDRVPIHTRYNLLHFSVHCDCGYKGEIDTYGEYGFWWKRFLHVHAQGGHRFTLSGEPVTFSFLLDDVPDPDRGAV